MKQPISNIIKTKRKKEIKKPERDLDGSGLETYFRINFLDKLGIEYVQQFEAVSIGRFYDFMIKNHNLILEIDGSYFHSDPRFFEKTNKMQKRNKRVDDVKNKWALINGFVLLRFWEYDIYNNPKLVMDELEKHLKIQNKKYLLSESKKNGTFFNKKK